MCGVETLAKAAEEAVEERNLSSDLLAECEQSMTEEIGVKISKSTTNPTDIFLSSRKKGIASLGKIFSCKDSKNTFVGLSVNF